MSNTEITAKSYTLRTEKGGWLAQVVLTSDGAFMCISDYGNFNFAWRHTGMKDFRLFLISLNVEYFAGKMYNGIVYVATGRKIEQSARRFAEEILPPLQKLLKEEIETESNI